MDNNFKLRKAIIIAMALMSTGYSLHSKAIGLGDIQVKSYLGQPLLANIKVSGLDQKMDERCFSVNSDDTNAINHVNFRLNRISDEVGVLTLTSNKAVLEPIASLTIVSHCDTTFTRQYSLLIDPASLTQDTDSNVHTSDHYVQQGNTSSGNVGSENADTLAAASSNTNATGSKRKTKRKHKQNTVSSTSIASQNNAQVTYLAPKQEQTTKSATLNTATATPTTASKPKLTISGGNLTGVDLSAMPMKLSFDKRINTSRESNPQAYSEQAEFADEVTVMNNRLAHLDKQINSLYTQNASLKQANARSQSELSSLKQQNDVLRMIAFCLGGGLLATGYFFVDWLRRKSFLAQAEKEQALWDSLQTANIDSDDTLKTDDNPPTSYTTAQPTPAMSDEASMELGNVPLFNSTYPSQQEHEIIHEETDIREDAELLISHGRIHLAIELLQNHLVETPKDSAATWLFLLDLLAKEGMQKEFEIAANECKKHFNVQVDGYSRPLADSDSLESFERISKELQKLWGTEQALIFLDELIYNTRLEPRAGFDKPVFEELVLLREIAEEEVKLAEVISLHEEKKSRKKKKDKTMTINLPEIEISDEFKQLALETSKENVEIAQANSSEDHFEFELLDIAHR